ncbi:hypothetical protein B0H17DRAFT_1193647 [Mycena rosella]|uniref:Uncharacterized protein n=1 Tax=Mycena rosella TaxID=1033263 RepID=A0AAD7GSK8_MYCRO|nr:hypothetical protein B0H17DRAFT_1193647 [Mycena rosella]
MRFALTVFVLAAVAAATKPPPECAVCPKTLPPGVSEIAWTRVAADEDAGTMFCGYRGKERGNPKTLETFCSYYNNGTLIKNPGSLKACPKTVKVEKCKKQ